MNYSKNEVMQYISEEDVKFIRLAFCDVFGKQKNISIMQNELERAFENGIAIDASMVKGFGNVVLSDLYLHPDPATISVLPWRPEHGKVVRMFCSITYPDGKPFEADARTLLQNAISDAKAAGVNFFFGSETEFYLFKRDEDGNPTSTPYDFAGYMDIAPDDKSENVRREICLTLGQMGIKPESSHHEEGPGQNVIDFRHSDPLKAADDAVTFRAVVNTIAARNGLFADFSPKPIADKPGNGMRINISASVENEHDVLPNITAGIMSNIVPMTLFLNPKTESYNRFGKNKAPKYISWSTQIRSQLIRVPAVQGQDSHVELRSPDPTCNPYIAFTLLIRAGLDGIKNNPKLPQPADFNFNDACAEVLEKYSTLPMSLECAKTAALESEFITDNLPKCIIDNYAN